MALRCVAIRMSTGGHHHEHITHIQVSDGTLHTRAWMVAYVEAKGQAYVQDSRGNVAYLGVRTSLAGNKYVQTYADGLWSDNLLALPRV